MEHDEFEILIEKRLHGAIAPDEDAVLERHLAVCEACRRELAEDRGMDMALKANARVGAGLTDKDWTALERKVQEALHARMPGRGYRRVMMAALVLTCATLVGETVRSGFDPLNLLNLVVFGFYLWGLPLLIRRGRERAQRVLSKEAEERRLELIAVERSRLRTSEIGAWTLSALFLAATVVPAWTEIADPATRIGVSVVIGMHAAAFMTYATFCTLARRDFVRRAQDR